jgi:amidase
VPGPITRSIDDLELIWNSLRRDSPYNSQLDAVKPTKKLAEYRIAWIDDWEQKIYTGRDVKAKISKLIKRLKTEGVKTSKDAPDLFVEMSQVALLLASFSWFFDFSWMARKFSKAGLRMMSSKRLDPLQTHEVLTLKNKKTHQKALDRRQRLIEKTDEFFQKYDFLIIPISAGPAIEIGGLAPKIRIDNKKMHYWDYFAYGQVFNATGHPVISIPLGFNDKGLPIGAQVVGKYYSEKELLHFARLIEPLHDGFNKPIALIREYAEKSIAAGFAVIS